MRITSLFLGRGRRRPDRGRAARLRARPCMELLDGRILLHGDVLHDVSGTATAQVAVPVHADPQEHLEHQAMLDLVRREEATHVAATGGDWSAIWGQDRPGAGARVLIPAGVVVTVDGRFDEALKWIRVDGTLRFATDRDTALKVETIVVDSTGQLEIGSASRPIEAGREARIVFADLGPLDRQKDPLGLGRGLIAHGGLTIHGAETTSSVPLAAAPRRGDTVLRLSSVPVNWGIGGHLVLPGVHPDPGKNQDEELTILGIQGTVVTIDRPLAYDHILPDAVPVPLAYLDRNVVLTSENTADPDRRGHVMVMHRSVKDRSIAYVELDGLGRTRADRLVTDPQLDADGRLIPDTTGNDRGRYALHFHHTGVEDPAHPAIVRGIAVVHGLKWGVVNHQGNVIVEDSVSYDVAGAGFVTESGTEIGAFRRDLAIRSVGSGGLRRETEGLDLAQGGLLPEGDDLGWAGYGFWLQGGGVPVVDCTAIGHARDAFSIYTRPLKRADEFLVSNLPPWRRGSPRTSSTGAATGRPSPSAGCRSSSRATSAPPRQRAGGLLPLRVPG